MPKGCDQLRLINYLAFNAIYSNNESLIFQPKQQMPPMKKIIAFAGSNSQNSINLQLVRYVATLLPDAQVEVLDLNTFEMPIYSIDREKDQGIPDTAHRFRAHMEKADGILCSMAEHNKSYTVAFKNILDWCSRVDMNIFKERPMLLMSTSPGGYGGGNVMATAKDFFPKAKADITATFSLPKFYDNFKEGSIQDGDLQKELDNSVAKFVAAL